MFNPRYRWIFFVFQMLELLGWDADAPTVRCPDDPSWTEASTREIAYMGMLLLGWYTVTVRFGLGTWTVTSMLRRQACNDRRGGVPQSLHRESDAMTREGAALDADPIRDSDAETVRSRADEIPGILRSATGWHTGVGVIVYPSGRIHLDVRPRENDFVDVR